MHIHNRASNLPESTSGVASTLPLATDALRASILEIDGLSTACKNADFQSQLKRYQ